MVPVSLHADAVSANAPTHRTPTARLSITRLLFKACASCCSSARRLRARNRVGTRDRRLGTAALGHHGVRLSADEHCEPRYVEPQKHDEGGADGSVRLL